MISIPYTDTAGILADDWESGSRLIVAALTLANELGADHLELRQDGNFQASFQQQKTIGTWCYTAHTFKTGLLRPLPASVDALWWKLSAKVHNQIRKARRCGCLAKAGGVELLADFYSVFSENMRDLGSPVHAPELFQNLLGSESLKTAIIVIYLHDKPVAAAVVLLHNKTLYNPWASSLRSYRPFCPNMLLYWSIIEDVGWWQGEDGSAAQQPYRNDFPRRHCLADYQALVRFADRLGVRIGLGMVVCEWDRNNSLGGITGATWMGNHWNNRINQGPWLDEAAEYLRHHQGSLELGLHALCHEFWHEGKMERSEFHDRHGNMRSRRVITSHLEAFGIILEQNGFSEFPRLFFPPALNHSFGNDKESIQALLYDYGIRYVITRFSRARRFSPPYHEKITWECGVGLLERGLSPVPWNVSASLPGWNFSGPILPLHWGNLLHPDAEHNNDIVDGWAEMLLAGTAGPERILAENYDTCWRQAAIFYFGKLSLDGASIVIDLQALPKDMPNSSGSFFLKVMGLNSTPLRSLEAQIVSDRLDDSNIHTLQLLPEKGRKKIRLFLS